MRALTTSSSSFTLASPFCLILFTPPPPTKLPTLFPSPLYYCQAVKWMLAYFRALLSNSLSCTGQVRGSAECNLAADETSTQKQLAWPPTIAWRATHLFCSQVKQRVLFISKGQNPLCQRISDLLMWDVYTAGKERNRKKLKQSDVKRAAR